MPSSAGELFSRSFRASNGAAAKGTASAPSTAKLKSGMANLRGPACPALQVRKEVPDLLPHLGSAGKSSPVPPNQTHQAIALVDWDEVVLRSGRPAKARDPIHEQRFDVRLHGGEGGILIDNLLPGFK